MTRVVALLPRMPGPPSGKPKALITTWIAPAIISVMIAR